MLPLATLPLLLSVTTQAPSTDLEAFLLRLVAPALEREGVPGISVAVMQDGELLLARGFGWADERLGLPVQPATAFPIGSLGRSLVGAAALREVERGALRLDAPIGKVLPDVPERLQPITLQQLLEGSSGLPASSALFDALERRAPAERLTRKAFLELLAELPAQDAPGASFASDSSAWLVLPLLIDEAGKRSFADCLEQELCGPLGLRDTRVRGEFDGALGHAADCREVLAGRALEIRTGFEPRAASAQILGTAGDLVRWQNALFQHALLSPASTRLLTESARSRTGEPLGRNASFELGELGGQPCWRHVGGIAGWRGALGWYEGAHIAVCVLANCPSARVGEIEDELARFLLRLPPRELQDLPLEPGESALLGGNYQLGTLRVRIFEREGRLWYESAAEEPFRMRSQGFRRFVSADGEALLVFSGESPRAASFAETRKGASSVARRMD
jgi:CubicO group peptidase (beta-lactamase class C family)